MARTKKTARKSTGGKHLQAVRRAPLEAPRPPTQAGKPNVRRFKADAPNIFSKIVTVTVDDDDDDDDGDGPKVFDVDPNLLSRHSNFFARAIENHDGRSGKRQIIHAPASGHEAFKIFVQFIHTGGIYSAASDEETYAAIAEGADDEYHRIIGCWQLADAIASTSLKDALTDCVISKLVEQWIVPDGLHLDIYPCSRADSPIRRLLIDIAVHLWSEDAFAQWRDDVEAHGAEFYFDLCKELHRTRGKTVAKPQALQNGENTCTYHEHVVQGLPCYKTMF